MKTFMSIVCLSIGLLTYTSAQAQEKACCAKSGESKEQCCAKKSSTCEKKDTCTKRESCSKKESCSKSNAQATQKTGIVTETFTVLGSCSMCKTRIENAALIKGVKSAEWNKEAHSITVIYDAGKDGPLHPFCTPFAAHWRPDVPANHCGDGGMPARGRELESNLPCPLHSRRSTPLFSKGQPLSSTPGAPPCQSSRCANCSTMPPKTAMGSRPSTSTTSNRCRR